MTRTRLVIFDLDGTLIDTIADLGDSVNFALAKRGLSLHTTEEYKLMVGHGIRNLNISALEKSLGSKPSEELVDECLKDFVQYYMDHIDAHTRPYEGIHELLRRLQSKEIKLAVASNKFQAGAEKLIREFFPDIEFVAILGNSPELPLKPDASVVEYILEKAGVTREQTVMVGDSATDIKTARNGRVRSMAVSWGFRPVSDLQAADSIAYSVNEIEDLIQ